MKSDVILIDNQETGFEAAVDEAKKVAVYRALEGTDALHVQLITEEMLSMAHSVTGINSASFWIEAEGKEICFHLTAKTVMDKEKKEELLAAATSRQNDAAVSFLGKLRDAFENALMADVDHGNDIPDDIMEDLANHEIESLEYDGYERSVLRKLADNIKIGIRGDTVDMKVTKKIA